jgi:hypothetical protein
MCLGRCAAFAAIRSFLVKATFKISELKGRTRTLWIGRTDFLIHQVKTVTSAEALKTALAEAAKSHPEIAAPPLVSALQGITSIETHANIILNQKSSPADFDR